MKTALKPEEQKARWDMFLDAYSTFLRDPSLSNAAALHLAGRALEDDGEAFSMREFEHRLGWDLGNETAA
ncbi:MAG: hypothetical protein HY340_02020 [Candidatus Kerfeldbacteria bacterium]|nr:hypothetical protein [Candidatus Kerfeldbacteria bacterium]